MELNILSPTTPNLEISFRQIKRTDLTPDFMRDIARFAVDYIERSGDHSLMPLQILNVAHEACLKPDVPFHFWLLIKKDVLCGYAITEFTENNGKLELNITQAYVGDGAREDNVQDLTIMAFEGFAKAKGCKFLTSMTRRGTEDGYARWMGRAGFRKRYVVMEKEIA